MPSIECAGCGRTTNTALSDWTNSIDTGKATRCYAAWDEEKSRWVEGCGINDEDADRFSVYFAKKRILKGGNNVQRKL